MNNRFSKGYPVDIDYPVTSVLPSTITVDGEQRQSRLVSPRIGNPHGLPTPSHYGGYGYFQELQEVIEVRDMVANGVWPATFLKKHHPESDRFDPLDMPAPLRAKGLTVNNPAMCANAVHMDSPSDMPDAILSWLHSEGALLKTRTGHIDFVGGVPQVQADISARILRNLGRAFEAKYYFGRMRPEEAQQAMYDDKGMDVNCATMTAYPEGCPNHPAFPAGHGAAASSVSVFDNHFVLSENLKNVIFDTAYLWAMFRSLAGVHFANDNLAGLAIGGMVKWDAVNVRWVRSW